MKKEVEIFVDTVKTMRTMQKDYFKNRNRENFIKSKALEHEVDVMVEQITVDLNRVDTITRPNDH